MSVFEVLPSDTPAHDATIDGVSRWSIPSIACTVCGGYGGLGESYPTVDLADLPERAWLEEARSLQEISLEQYQHLIGQLRPRVPQGAPLEPGTQLGPIEARSSGHFSDIFFQEPWLPWMTRSALEQLQALDVRGLRGAPGTLRHRGKTPPPELLAMEIQVRGNLHPSCLASDWQAACARCGSHRNGYPDESAVLDVKSVPTDVDLFRLREFKTVIFASTRFVEAVHRLQLRDIRFRERPAR